MLIHPENDVLLWGCHAFFDIDTPKFCWNSWWKWWDKLANIIFLEMLSESFFRIIIAYWATSIMGWDSFFLSFALFFCMVQFSTPAKKTLTKLESHMFVFQRTEEHPLRNPFLDDFPIIFRGFTSFALNTSTSRTQRPRQQAARPGSRRWRRPGNVTPNGWDK